MEGPAPAGLKVTHGRTVGLFLLQGDAMLVLWSGADDKALKKVVGGVLAQAMVEYRVSKDVTEFPATQPGDVVLAFGSKALATLQALKLVPKGRTVTSMREKELKWNGASVFCTFDPGVTSREYARLPEIQWDTQLATRVVKTGTTRPTIGTYRWVESFHETIEAIEAEYERTGKPVEVACDTETLSLVEHNPDAWIISISFTYREGFSDAMYFENGEVPVEPPPFLEWGEMDYWQGVWSQLHWLLTTDKISLRGANWKYDSRWIKQKWNILCTNHKFDTLLVGSLLDENRSNSLKLHAKLMTPMGGYEDDMDKYDFSRLDLVPKEELIHYMGGDTDATLRVANVMKPQLLADKRLCNFYIKLAHPASHAFEKMERTGILVDVPYYQNLKAELEVEIHRLHGAMLDMLPNKMRIKYKDKIADCLEQNKMPLTPTILKEFLFTPSGLNLKPQVFTEKTQEPSTSLDHLMMFEDDPVAANFISLFREHGSAAKTYSTYVVGFLKHLRPDGRFHPTFLLAKMDYNGDAESGTDTGRTSAKDPAVQTIPKHTKWTKKLRRAYIPPPGYTIIQLDYSQGELRITAVVAEEPTMIQAYRDGMDLHAITAAALNGYSLDDFFALDEDVRDALRSGGKAGNFGLIYGMQALGFREYAYVSYGVSMTEQEAYQKREAFFARYPRLPAWHDEYKAHAKRWGFVRSPLGRVRHLPLINSSDREMRSKSERQAVNSPIQSCLSDMMQLAMVHIDRQYGDADIHPFLMTHDSLALYVPEDDAVEWAKRLKLIMENLPLERDFGWSSPLKFIADAEMSVADDSGIISLASLKKLKGL